MEIVLITFSVAFVVLVGYFIMRESDEDRREKEKAKAFIARMQAEQARAVAAAYERQSHKHVTPRSAPVTTGKPVETRVTTRPTPQVNRRDNSFDLDVDTYTTPTYHSSHKSSGGYSDHCSGGSSSSSDSGGSSGGDSGGGGCD